MQLNAYSIYDDKALVYGVPFFAPTHGSAIRSLRDLANDPNTTVGRHPRDFVLYLIGSYDDERGIIRPLSPLQHVIDAVALVEKAQPMLPVLPADDESVSTIVKEAIARPVSRVKRAVPKKKR